MPDRGTEAKVRTLPKCSLHPDRDAHYDFRVRGLVGYDGAWMYGCKWCFMEYGRGLGIGLGQVLVVDGDA